MLLSIKVSLAHFIVGSRSGQSRIGTYSLNSRDVRDGEIQYEHDGSHFRYGTTYKKNIKTVHLD